MNNGKNVGRSGNETQHQEEEPLTERGLERIEEEEESTPVILKRTDEIGRHPDDMLKTAIKEGLEQLERPFFSLLLSSVAAGLILGFTAMAVGVVSGLLAGPEYSEFLKHMTVAVVYPIGFVVCIISGSQLFTEHTATAVYPVLDKKAPPLKLLRLWSVVALGNLMGAYVIAAILSMTDNVSHSRQGFVLVAEHLIRPDFFPLLCSAVLAGWLMALGAWLMHASPMVLGQIVLIYCVTFLIGVGGFHHSIAGSVELFLAIFLSKSFPVNKGMFFIGVALLGNLIGGSVFVATLNYAHIRRTQVVY
ncbi:MAG: formate/nitrite transporter family protein [Desulfobulbaceae bacterium]|nr:formate/nitrite transporter family protein [Desulfobulbaceae bacterium]